MNDTNNHNSSNNNNGNKNILIGTILNSVHAFWLMMSLGHAGLLQSSLI